MKTAPRVASVVLIAFGSLVLILTALATALEIRSGVIMRRPFGLSPIVVVQRDSNPREFWTQIARRLGAVGVIGGGVIALGVYFRRLDARGTTSTK